MLDSTEKVIWAQAAERLEIQAGICCQINEPEVKSDFYAQVESAFNIPIAPLNGVQNSALIDVILDCLKVPQTHEHNIDRWALSNVIRRLNGDLHRSAIVMFSTALVGDKKYCFLGFPQNNKRTGQFSAAEGVCKTLAEIAFSKSNDRTLKDRLNVMELYVREVGHDLAGSIQAIVAKMAYISRGNLSDSAMRTKATEAWLEVRNAHAIAECLGIAVDPDYAIGNSSSFPLDALLAEIAQDYEAEAKENNIKIKVADTRGVSLWGDRLPLKLAIVNIVKNAIKYAYSDSDVEIGFRSENDRIILFARNRGIGLPSGRERKKIWDFGFRCARARKINVNGSGIGLFSCKKIILSHGGQVWEDDNRGITTFHIALPANRFRMV